VNIGELVNRHVPEPWFNEALGVVQRTSTTIGTNEDRRGSAVDFLMAHLHVPEHLAQLLVQLAVLWLKHQDDSAPATG
jgi:hypothetical protein